MKKKNWSLSKLPRILEIFRRPNLIIHDIERRSKLKFKVINKLAKGIKTEKQIPAPRES